MHDSSVNICEILHFVSTIEDVVEIGYPVAEFCPLVAEFCPLVAENRCSYRLKRLWKPLERHFFMHVQTQRYANVAACINS